MKKLLSVLLCFVMVLSMAGLTVSAEATAQEVADSISVDTITTEIASLITEDLTLPTEIDGMEVTWASDNDAITNEGHVTRHATEETAVTLTATVGREATKEINLTVAPLTTTVVYQNNFGKQLDGTAFDTTKELIGASVATTQVGSWTMSTAQTAAPFGTTVGETGGILLDLNTRANSPTFSFPEAMDSPFYVQFDVKMQAAGSGIDLRMNYTKEDGTKPPYTSLYRWTTGGTTNFIQGKLPSSQGGTNFASTETTKTTMRVYIDPINFTAKFMDADGKMVPDAGIKLVDGVKNCAVTSIYFCRAGSTSAAGYIEFDNFAVYRTAAETKIYNDRETILKELLEDVTFADFSSEDVASVTTDLDLATFKKKIESENEGVTVSYNSSNEDVLNAETGVITRALDNTAVKLEVVVSKGDSTFGKTIEFTVEEAFNPAKQAAGEILFEMLTKQSAYAVTDNLDLSIEDFYALDVAEGATVTFTSSNEDVLAIDGTVGRITQGDEKADVTLTVTVAKEERTFSKDFTMTVLPAGAYVFESENFYYPNLVGESIDALDRWVIENKNSRATYADVAKDDSGYYLETARTKTGTYENGYYYTSDMRKTKKVTFEMDVLLNEMPSGTYQDLYFLGAKAGGAASVNTGTAAPTKYLCQIRIQPTGIYFYGKSTSSRTIAEGETHKITIDFDFENDSFTLYFDGALVQSSIDWKDSGADYEGLYAMDICSFQGSASFKIGIDNLSVYSENSEFIYSDLEEEIDSDRPLTVSTSKMYGNRYNGITVTSDYDEDNLLKQNIVEKNETFTNNPIIDFYGTYLVNRETGNETSLVGYITPDETCPHTINGLYIGSNHGGTGVRVTSTAHGKTYADVGSVWEDEKGVKWDLVRVEDDNTLFFIGQKEIDLATQNFNFSSTITGSLTYVSDGVNTGSITVESFKADQTFPSIANVEHTFYIVRDGEKIEFDSSVASISYKCDELVIVEEYDIINPLTIAEALRKGKPEGGYEEAPSIAVGEKILHYKQTITVKADGTVFTEIDHTVLTQLNSYDNYGYQFYPRNDIFGGGVWRQVPGTTEFTDGIGDKYDISAPIEYTIVRTSGDNWTDEDYPIEITLNSGDWVNPDVVPSRILDFYQDEDGNNVMGYMTGYLPIYDGEPSVRKTKTNTNIYMYDKKLKAYPIFVSSSGSSNKSSLTAKGANIKGVSYRKYVDLRDFEENNTQYYAINHENKTYYYVDFIEAGTQTLDLTESGCIYDLTKVEAVSDNGDITYKQVGDAIEVTSEGRGYLVLKAERRLEVESAYFKPANGEAGIRFVNYSDKESTVKLAIASYQGNKLADIKTVANVTVGANETLNKAVDVSLVEGDKYKLFVLENTDSIAPVSKDMVIEIK